MNRLLWIVYILTLPTTHAQEQWTQLEDAPLSSRDDGTAFIVGDDIWYGTGMEVGFTTTNDFAAYDPATDSWSPAVPVPGKSRQYAVSFTVVNTTFLIGGIGDQGWVSTLDILYNGTWQTDTMKGKQLAGAAIVPWASGAYILGGRTPWGYSDTIWFFDATKRTFTHVAFLPQGPRDELIVEKYGNDLYIAGGKDSNNVVHDDFLKVNMSTNTLTYLPSCPYPVSYGAGAAIGSHIYIFPCDKGGFSLTEKVYKFNLYKDQWEEASKFPEIPKRGYSAVTMNNKVYFFGGVDSTGSRTNSTWVFDPGDDLDLQELLVFPNPFTDKIYLHSPGFSGEAKVHVVNSAGQIVFHRELPLSVVRAIPLEPDLPEGVYIVYVQFSETEHRVAKIAKVIY